MPRGGKREKSGRPSPWKHSKTQLIRVPEEFVEEVLKFARKLDEKKSTDALSKQEISSTEAHLASQMSLLDLDTSQRLTETALSKRLKVHPSTTRKFRLEWTSEKFAAWVRRKDPEGCCWQYDTASKRYCQVLEVNQ